jgi:hypothetical protein
MCILYETVSFSSKTKNIIAETSHVVSSKNYVYMLS